MKAKSFLLKIIKDISDILSIKRLSIITLGLCISSFGVYNIHQQSNITEGGAIGLILFIHHWTGLSPSIVSPLVDMVCYGIALRFLGWNFLKLSAVSTCILAGFFKLWEQFPPLIPSLLSYPILAAVLGGMFVGIGVGLVVSQGGSSGGDDALALAITKSGKIRISKVYFITDLIVLVFSISYIPLNRIGYSFITVTISSLLVEWMHNLFHDHSLED
ncbi:MAG: YitT family protein [Anaerocolumna sp.]